MISAIKFNPSKNGLRTLFREWQISTLRLLWENPNKKFTTKEVWTRVKTRSKIEVSRATIYHFLDEMSRKGILGNETGMGRGGERILFFSEYTEMEFRELMAHKLIDAVNENLMSPD